MEINLYSAQEVTVLELTGRIDSHSVHKLRSQLTKCIYKQPAYVVVDLTGVIFIDSSGLAALVQGMRGCRSGGGNLCLSNPQRPVRMILEMTRLDSAIDIFPSHNEAIAHFQTPA